MCLIFQEIRFQVQVLKPCKFVQESSEKVQDFKAQQLVSIELVVEPRTSAAFKPQLMLTVVL